MFVNTVNLKGADSSGCLFKNREMFILLTQSVTSLLFVIACEIRNICDLSLEISPVPF